MSNNGTSTAPTACRFVVEMQAQDGYRFWSAPMHEGDVDQYIDGMISIDYMLSDIDHTGAGCFHTCTDPLD